MAKSILKQISESLLGTGHLKIEDFKSESILAQKIIDIIDSSHFHLVIDHRKTIENLAKKFYDSKNLEISIFFYSLYFEQTLNYIIHVQLIKNGKNPNLTKNIIKATNIEAKLSWVLELLNLPEINEKHKKIILLVSQERNSFIHYKWMDDSNHINIKLFFKSYNINKTIIYLKKYESRIRFNGNKKNLRKTSK
ncbi:hypothetical protein CLV96_3984 [Leptospira meyeri]|uniref:Uncharacterized protein n=2 Tax=Leptospira meyeri TaxID=29508 RepID=A0A4R8MID8_LEPME|nr:hypothetical protein LEP1GSC017_0462 [Leptospira meyeri serovar Hardjo str. Went 5]TDY66131.1 hypothetical protein CLV96_3984 [Leptospira meyeri]